MPIRSLPGSLVSLALAAALYGAVGVHIAHADPVGARSSMPTQVSADLRMSDSGSYDSSRGEMVNGDASRPSVLALIANNPSVPKQTSKPGRHSKHRQDCLRRKTPHKHAVQCVKSHVTKPKHSRTPPTVATITPWKTPAARWREPAGASTTIRQRIEPVQWLGRQPRWQQCCVCDLRWRLSEWHSAWHRGCNARRKVRSCRVANVVAADCSVSHSALSQRRVASAPVTLELDQRGRDQITAERVQDAAQWCEAGAASGALALVVAPMRS